MERTNPVALQAAMIMQLENRIKDLENQLKEGFSLSLPAVIKENMYYKAYSQILKKDNEMLLERQRSIIAQADPRQIHQIPVQELPNNMQSEQRLSSFKISSNSGSGNKVQPISNNSFQFPSQSSPITSANPYSNQSTIRSNIFSSSSDYGKAPSYTPAQIQNIKNNIQNNQPQAQNQLLYLNKRLDQAPGRNNSQDQLNTQNQTNSNTSQANLQGLPPRPPGVPLVIATSAPHAPADKLQTNVSPSVGNISHTSTPPSALPIQSLINQSNIDSPSHEDATPDDVIAFSPSPDISLPVPSSPVKEIDQSLVEEKAAETSSSSSMWPLNLLNGLFSKAGPTPASVIKGKEDSNSTKDNPLIETEVAGAVKSGVGSPQLESGNNGLRDQFPSSNPPNKPVDPRIAVDPRISPNPAFAGLSNSTKFSLSPAGKSDLKLTTKPSVKPISLSKMPKKSAMKPTKPIPTPLPVDEEDEILHDDEFQSNVDKFLENGPLSSPAKANSASSIASTAKVLDKSSVGDNFAIPVPSVGNTTLNRSQSGDPSIDLAPVAIKTPILNPANPVAIKASASLPPTVASSTPANQIRMKVSKSSPGTREISMGTKVTPVSSIHKKPNLSFIAGPPRPIADKIPNQSPVKKMKLLVTETSSDESLSDGPSHTPQSKREGKPPLKRPGSDLKLNTKSRKHINKTNATIEELPNEDIPSTAESIVSFETLLSEQTEKNNLLRPASSSSSKSYQNLMKTDKSSKSMKFYGKSLNSTPSTVVTHSYQNVESSPFSSEATGIIKLSVKKAWYRKAGKSQFESITVAKDTSIKFVYRKGVDLSFRTGPIENADLDYIQMGSNGLELLFVISLKTEQEIFVHTYTSVERIAVSRSIDPFYLNEMSNTNRALFDKLSKKKPTSSISVIPTVSEPAKPSSFKLSITKSWLTTPSLPMTPLLVGSDEQLVFSAEGIVLPLKSPDLISYSQIERVEYSTVADIILLIICLAEEDQIWIKSTGSLSGILDIVKCNVLVMKKVNINQFHKNDTGKFPPPEKYEILKRKSENSGVASQKKSPKKSPKKNSAKTVSSSASVGLKPWVEVAKENISGTSKMRKAETNTFRSFVREYLVVRFGNPLDYMIADSTGKKDYGIPSDKVDDFVDWYGEKAVEKIDREHRDMLQKLHKSEKLRAIEKRI